MPRISDERRDRQRQRILDAGTAVLLRRGVAGVSIGAVIEESGLSAGAIYGYFSGKDELVLAVARGILSSRARRLVELADQRPVPAPRQGLTAFLESLPHEVIRSGALLQLWGEAGHRPDLLEHARAALDELEGAMGSYVAAWLVHGRGEEEPDARRRAGAAAPALLALVQGFVVQSTLRGGLDVAKYVDDVGAATGLFTEP